MQYECIWGIFFFFAMAAVLLHPIIMSCEKHINLRVDKNMCARTSFPPHRLAALISFYVEHTTPESTSVKMKQYMMMFPDLF